MSPSPTTRATTSPVSSPSDFVISEDGITEKLATFEEGNGPHAVALEARAPEAAAIPPQGSSASRLAGDSRRCWPAPTFSFSLTPATTCTAAFVFAQDAIADFVRSLETADKVAFYSYSRDLSRSAPLTPDRSAGRARRAHHGGRRRCRAVQLAAADAQGRRAVPGRKVVVVFSNGPDNASMVPPEDVAELAQSVGIPIYMISTREARLEPVSTAVFERMSAATGGKAYFANSWRDEKRAFASIRDDLAHLYSLQLLPAAQSQSRLARHQGEAGRRIREEVPRPHAQRLSPDTQSLHQRASATANLDGFPGDAELTSSIRLIEFGGVTAFARRPLRRVWASSPAD